MGTVHYNEAVVLIEGTEISAQISDVAVNFSAEMLDATAMGDDTRKHKGGLQDFTVEGTGFFKGGLLEIDGILFDLSGDDDTVVTVYPRGVTEGSAEGYGLHGVVEVFTLGGTVGTLLPVSFTIQSRMPS